MTTSRGIGSRNPTGRPRRLATQPHPVADAADPVAEPTEPNAGPPEPPEPPGPGDEGPGGGHGRRRTIALVVAIAVLLVVGVLELVYLNRDASAAPSPERPVVVGDATRGEAVETAARSTEEILSTTYQSYDDQVEQAMQKMTDTFAQQYKQTSDGIRDRFIAQKTQLQVKAVGQSVVQASSSQVQALLFLNQYVQKVVDGQPKTDFAQYRALVTVVHTEHGWLVSDIDTK
jgi:Mce-associated membrane protein